jgi:hypothetical protein
MIRKALQMLFGPRQPQAALNPDPIKAEMSVAVQANERAGANARAALEEMLATSDRVRGLLLEASDRARGKPQ